VGLPTVRWKQERVCAKAALATDGTHGACMAGEDESECEEYTSVIGDRETALHVRLDRQQINGQKLRL
jgi:hypothetical protein